MRKVSLLLSTMGGALAGYILTNEKLRKALSNAKDPETAAKMLGQNLMKDGKKIAKEVQAFVESDDVQQNLKKAKTYATEKMMEAKMNFEKMAKDATKKAKKMMK
jgi:uncharacterized membrane protein YheB (UPF0754 family)